MFAIKTFFFWNYIWSWYAMLVNHSLIKVQGFSENCGTPKSLVSHGFSLNKNSMIFGPSFRNIYLHPSWNIEKRSQRWWSAAGHGTDPFHAASSQVQSKVSFSTGSSEMASKTVCCLLADVQAELRRLIAGSKHVPCWASAWNVAGETRDVAAMECHGMQWTCWCEVGAGLTGLRYGGAPIETRSGWSLSACTPKRLGSNFWILYSGFLPEVGSGCKGACERWKQMGDLNSPERLKAWLTVVWDGLAVGSVADSISISPSPGTSMQIIY